MLSIEKRGSSGSHGRGDQGAGKSSRRPPSCSATPLSADARQRLHRRRPLSLGNFDSSYDGFSGNIALKTDEVTARFGTTAETGLQGSTGEGGFASLRRRSTCSRSHLDPPTTQWRGLSAQRAVVKSPAGANPKRRANAIGVAARMVLNTSGKDGEIRQFPRSRLNHEAGVCG